MSASAAYISLVFLESHNYRVNGSGETAHGATVSHCKVHIGLALPAFGQGGSLWERLVSLLLLFFMCKNHLQIKTKIK